MNHSPKTIVGADPNAFPKPSNTNNGDFFYLDGTPLKKIMDKVLNRKEETPVIVDTNPLRTAKKNTSQTSENFYADGRVRYSMVEGGATGNALTNAPVKPLTGAFDDPSLSINSISEVPESAMGDSKALGTVKEQKAALDASTTSPLMIVIPILLIGSVVGYMYFKNKL